MVLQTYTMVLQTYTMVLQTYTMVLQTYTIHGAVTPWYCTKTKMLRDLLMAGFGTQCNSSCISIILHQICKTFHKWDTTLRKLTSFFLFMADHRVVQNHSIRRRRCCSLNVRVMLCDLDGFYQGFFGCFYQGFFGCFGSYNFFGRQFFNWEFAVNHYHIPPEVRGWIATWYLPNTVLCLRLEYTKVLRELERKK